QGGSPCTSDPAPSIAALQRSESRRAQQAAAGRPNLRERSERPSASEPGEGERSPFFLDYRRRCAGRVGERVADDVKRPFERRAIAGGTEAEADGRRQRHAAYREQLGGRERDAALER